MLWKLLLNPSYSLFYQLSFHLLYLLIINTHSADWSKKIKPEVNKDCNLPSEDTFMLVKSQKTVTRK